MENQIVIDDSKMEIGDLDVLSILEGSNKNEIAKRMPELTAFLDRVVVGGARHLPMAQFANVIEAVGEHLKILFAKKS